jgi:tungstate transport system substrate-binding protein
MSIRQNILLLTVIALFGQQGTASSQTTASITLASTTSVENSGLLAQILPIFTKQTGITIHVLAQGTGQALQTAARDDADLVLVHDPEAEAKFIAAGDGIDRTQIAWNDFIIVGPKGDPAKILGSHDAIAAFRAIAAASAPFVSRGDKSGTDALEKRLWHAAGVDPAGAWYRDIGGGMGAALNTSAAIDAYTLSDRGTWLSFQNKRSLIIVVERDPRLINRYDVILLNPAKHTVPKQALAERFVRWLSSSEGQAAIGAYAVDGQQLFHPSADQPK